MEDNLYEKQKQYQKTRYQTDSEYREKIKARNREYNAKKRALTVPKPKNYIICEKCSTSTEKKGSKQRFCPPCGDLAKKARVSSYMRQYNSTELRQITQKEWRYKNLYGITTAEYEILLDAQDGVCYLCKHTCPTGNALAVDHAHETDELLRQTVRGLLCSPCNQALGLLKENPLLLADYVIQYINDRPAQKLLSEEINEN